MAETKDEIAAERDALRAENEQMKARLAAAGVSTQTAAPAHTFQLSEGDRQELVMRGLVTINGQVLTRDEIRARLGDDQSDVELGDVEPDARVLAAVRRPGNTRGVDFVYPSVAPGLIDPAVAGTPGINGPAAAEKPLNVAPEQGGE
jgi:hypothetical protein